VGQEGGEDSERDCRDALLIRTPPPPGTTIELKAWSCMYSGFPGVGAVSYEQGIQSVVGRIKDSSLNWVERAPCLHIST